MEPKLIQTQLAQYVPAEFKGKNESGILPLFERVLILPDQAAKEVGGVYIPDDARDRQTMASESGVIIASGPAAFTTSADRMLRWDHPWKPRPGTRVAFERYAGAIYMGNDGLMYRIMEDKNIGAIQIESLPEEERGLASIAANAPPPPDISIALDKVCSMVVRVNDYQARIARENPRENLKLLIEKVQEVVKGISEAEIIPELCKSLGLEG